jgi:K+-transporting ATPase ATPase B chain
MQAQLASLADETPEGRSIVVLAKEKYGIRARDMAQLHATFVPFTAQSRMSGVDIEGSSIRKGAVEAVLSYVASQNRRPARTPSVKSRRLPTRSPSLAARRWLSSVMAACWASST